MLEKLWGILYLINYHRWLVFLKEQRRIALRKFPCHYIVKAYIRSVSAIRKLFQHSGFSDLSCSGHKNHLEKITHFTEFTFRFTLDIFHLCDTSHD